MNQYSIHYNKSKNELSELSVKYGSDKGSIISDHIHRSGWKYHRYTDIYDFILSGIRESATDVLECGIGTNNPNIQSSMGINGAPGASLRMWRDYFPNAHVTGLDIDPDIMFEEDRISTFIVDQNSVESINNFKNTVNKEFDFIIDDGLHEYDPQLTFFKNTFDLLKPNGIFIIEDCHNSYFQLIDYLFANGYQHLGFCDDSKFDSFIVIKKAGKTK